MDAVKYCSSAQCKTDRICRKEGTTYVCTKCGQVIPETVYSEGAD